MKHELKDEKITAKNTFHPLKRNITAKTHEHLPKKNQLGWIPMGIVAIQQPCVRASGLVDYGSQKTNHFR